VGPDSVGELGSRPPTFSEVRLQISFRQSYRLPKRQARPLITPSAFDPLPTRSHYRETSYFSNDVHVKVCQYPIGRGTESTYPPRTITEPQATSMRPITITSDSEVLEAVSEGAHGPAYTAPTVPFSGMGSRPRVRQKLYRERVSMAITALDLNARIFVAGHGGLVGSAIVRALRKSGYQNILTADRADLDLRRQVAVESWFASHQPDFVYLVAGTVGGIFANSTRPAEFIYDNIMIHSNLIRASYDSKVSKLLYLGSSCIYPRETTQPISEDQLLTGLLEPTNEAYAMAKISGVKMCEAFRTQYGANFISGMPTNLYGPGDNFDLQSSHVIPALMRKFEEARRSEATSVEVWGSGTPRREFLHVDDLADACLHLMACYEGAQHINIGTGEDISIADVAAILRDIICPGVEIRYDSSKPDGTPRKLLDVSKLRETGWTHSRTLREGLQQTYAWYLASHETAI
jgi:GDP-L-fucose synthase